VMGIVRNILSKTSSYANYIRQRSDKDGSSAFEAYLMGSELKDNPYQFCEPPRPRRIAS